MTGTKNDLINYRIARAKDTYDDASILAEREKWNSTINRLYYAAYYAVMALLLDSDLKPTTHNGEKSNFSEYFIKTGKIILLKRLGSDLRNKFVGVCLFLSSHSPLQIKFKSNSNQRFCLVSWTSFNFQSSSSRALAS